MPKCQICKSFLNKDSAYIITKDGKYKYYCNQDEYEKQQKEIQIWNDLYDYVRYEIFEYDKNVLLSTLLVKKLRELGTRYKYYIVLETFKQNKDTIRYYFKVKNFTSEYNQIAYMMAIIQNKINDVYLKFKALEKKKLSLKNITINSSDEEIANTKTQQHGNNGISRFVQEDI